MEKWAPVLRTPVTDSAEPTVVVVGDGDVEALVACVGGGDHGFGAILDPLHRPAQAEGRGDHHQLVLVCVVLQPEAPADRWCDHPHGRLRERQHVADRIADGVRSLVRRPHGQALRGGSTTIPRVSIGEP